MPTPTKAPTVKIDFIDLELITAGLKLLALECDSIGGDYYTARAGLVNDLEARLDTLPKPKWLTYQLIPHRGAE